MPFMKSPSPSPSPTGSPRAQALWKLNGLHKSYSQQKRTPPPAITFIPPLIDGACGTTPNARRSVLHQLQVEVSQATRFLPKLLWAAATSRTSVFEAVQHVALALIECCVLVSIVPLWLVLPGALFTMWLALCGALIMLMSWSLNANGTPGELIQTPSPVADGWMMGQENDDEQWLFVGGIGTSSRSVKDTLPRLAKLFSRSITAVHTPTYGLVADFLAAILQRCLNIVLPMSSSRVLYSQIRTALLNNKRNRVVILAHNTGAITISLFLRQLYAEVPMEKMSKLEIYTFGAMALEFTVPLGSSCGELMTYKGQHLHAPDFATDRPGPHIEHFAFMSDPLAAMGVLRSVQEDLEGRFCGSVFMLDCPGAAHYGSRPSTPRGTSSHAGSLDRLMQVKKWSRPLASLDDYMSCMFPETFQPSGTSEPARRSQRHRSILDGLLKVDRELAEKREFAALAKDSASHYTKGERKRLSWTKLGATVGGMNGLMDGSVGLEMTRRACRDCDGHRGRDVSWLVRYVSAAGHFGQENGVADGLSSPPRY